jgi:hypothetical protein
VTWVSVFRLFSGGWVTGASRILNLKNDANYRRFASVWSNGKFEIYDGFTPDHY